MGICRRDDELNRIGGGNGDGQRMVAVRWVAIVGCGGDAEVVGIVIAKDGVGEKAVCAGEFEVEALAWGGCCKYAGQGQEGCREER